MGKLNVHYHLQAIERLVSVIERVPDHVSHVTSRVKHVHNWPRSLILGTIRPAK
jgi:hypothetical protein